MIPTKPCPDSRPSKKIKVRKCRKKHAEIVVEKYLKGKKLYLLSYYGMHSNVKPDQFEQDASIVKSIIKRSLKKKKYGGKTLLEIRSIKKLLKYDKYKAMRRNIIGIRVTDNELKSIKSKAENRGLDTSDYCRMKLFA